MSGRGGTSAGAAGALCVQCGFPLPARRGPAAPSAPAGPVDAAAFCCFGCVLLNQIAGARSQRGEPSWIVARLGLAAFLSMNVMCLSLVLYAGDPPPPGAPGADPFALGMTALFRVALMLFSLPVLLLLGWPILESGLRRLRARGAGVDSLIALGAIAAFAVSLHATWIGSGPVYYETACMTLVLVTLGRYLEARARARAADSLNSLLSREPSTACVLRDGEPREVPLDSIVPCERVRVAPGARVPVDGTVLEGEGCIDESSLTGEPLPVFKSAGSRVLAGTTSVDAALLLRATATGEDRTAARVARLIEQARASRAPIERQADRVAAWFVPLAVAAAAATALYWGVRLDAGAGILRGLSVLLIACPCALGLATPLAIWEAIGSASRRGIVVRSGETIERLWSLRSIFFDKTGTLTLRAPRVARVLPAAVLPEVEVLALAATLEALVDHPLARAVVAEARGRGLRFGTARRFRVHPGLGLEGEVALDGAVARRVAVGSPGILEAAARRRERGAAGPAAGASIVVLVDGETAGRIEFEETLRPRAREVVDDLRRRGLAVGVLTGDRSPSAPALARRLGIEARSGLSPGDKAHAIEDSERTLGPAGMVGEGVNDAPALARAGVSFALGCGDDLAQEAAEVRLLRDDLGAIPWLLDLARRTRRVIRGNLFWAFAYNVVLIPLAMAGRLQPILAALAMIASSLFVVGHSAALGKSAAGSGGPRRADERVADGRAAAAEVA